MSCRKDNRTNFVHFSRQLKPQPPYNAHPYWWGIGDLSFHDRNGKTVWHQEIPEAGLFYVKGFFDWLNVQRFYIHGCQVRRDHHWGWILEFELSHEEAAKVWTMLFKDNPEVVSCYENEKGQFFLLKDTKLLETSVKEDSSRNGDKQ